MKVDIELAPVTITLETKEEVTNMFNLLKDAKDRFYLPSYCPITFIDGLQKLLKGRLYG